MTALFLKSLLGAAAVMLIALLSKSRSFYISGLVPLFPTFTLIAHYIVGAERTMAELRMTAVFGLFSLTPYAAYLVAAWFFSYRFNLAGTLLLATGVWLLLAVILVYGWTRWHPSLG